MQELCQLVNLVAAQEDDVSLVIYKGIAELCMGRGPDRKMFHATIGNRKGVSRLVQHLKQEEEKERYAND